MTLWPRLRDGEQLGYALEQSEDRALEIGDRVHSAGVGRLGGALLRAGVEPGECEAGEPDEECGDAVLHVVVVGSRLVAGEERRQRAAGSTQ